MGVLFKVDDVVIRLLFIVFGEIVFVVSVRESFWFWRESLLR